MVATVEVWVVVEVINVEVWVVEVINVDDGAVEVDELTVAAAASTEDTDVQAGFLP